MDLDIRGKKAVVGVGHTPQSRVRVVVDDETPDFTLPKWELA